MNLIHRNSRKVSLKNETFPRKEPTHEKTNNLQKRNKRRVTTKMIGASVFATRILFLYFLNPKFPASIHPLCLCSSVCVRPIRKLHFWFSHDAAQMQELHCNLLMMHTMKSMPYVPGNSNGHVGTLSSFYGTFTQH